MYCIDLWSFSKALGNCAKKVEKLVQNRNTFYKINNYEVIVITFLS